MRKREIVTVETFLSDPRAKVLIMEPELTTALETTRAASGQGIPVVILPEVVSMFSSGLSYLKYRTTWNFESVYDSALSLDERELKPHISSALLADPQMDTDSVKATAALLEIPEFNIFNTDDFLHEFGEDSEWRFQIVDDIVLIQAEDAWQKVEKYTAKALSHLSS